MKVKALRVFSAAVLVFALVAAFALPALAADGAPVVIVDGVRIDRERRSLIINDRVYVCADELGFALGATDVEYGCNTAEIKAPGLTVSVCAGSQMLKSGDRCYYMKDGTIVSGGKLMVQADALCRAFGAGIAWNDGSKTVIITSGAGERAAEYTQDDLYWLSHIIFAEAGGEELPGMIAVGNVVMNRVRSEEFPDSIYDVIFDCEFGIQFSPAYDGSIEKTPSEEAVLAAKMVFDGADEVGDCLYFSAEYIAATCWAGQNRPYVTQIGNHCFYA